MTLYFIMVVSYRHVIVQVLNNCVIEFNVCLQTAYCWCCRHALLAAEQFRSCKWEALLKHFLRIFT